MRAALLLSLLAFAAAAPLSRAQEAEESMMPVPPQGRAAWVKAKSSLLLFDSSGTLVNEIGLGQWEEPAAEGTVLRRTVRGGVSKDGRFAWAWEKAQTLKPGRNEKTMSVARVMRYLGATGSELFRNELADAPPGLDPAVASDDGETVLVAEHGPDAWILAAFDFTGNRLADAHGKGTIELAQLAPSGRYGLVRWHQLDQPPTYTVFDIARRSAEDMPSFFFPAAAPRITDDGRVVTGQKTVFQVR